MNERNHVTPKGENKGMTTTLNRDEWLEWRRQGIGSSDAAALVGLSPWKSPYALWAEKAGLIEDDTEETDNLEFGRRAEPMLSQWFHDRTGLWIAGEQTMCHAPDKPWMLCTLDGFVVESEGAGITDALGGAEIKTTSGSAEEWQREIPDHYRAQTQWQMAVTGFTRMYIPALHFAFGRRQFEVHIIERDDDDIAFLTKEAERFWTEHVLTGEPPKSDGSESTTRALKAAWTGERGEVVELDDYRDLVASWRLLKSNIKTAEDELAAVENELRAAMRNATEGRVDGEIVVSWRAQNRTGIDTKGLREIHPEIADEFTTHTTIRVLRAHNPKGKTA